LSGQEIDKAALVADITSTCGGIMRFIAAPFQSSACWGLQPSPSSPQPPGSPDTA
jgi:hypothetical protein